MGCRLADQIVCVPFFFFFNDTATTEIYTLSLHDALPISAAGAPSIRRWSNDSDSAITCRDRKSTRLNSSHTVISYAVFCLKKKKTIHHPHNDKRNQLQRRRVRTLDGVN